MENSIVVYEAKQALAKESGKSYSLTSPWSGETTKLARDIDFGVIPKTKKPSLYKAGAEKICMSYGLMQRYTIESKIEQVGEDPLFFYSVRCDLVKIAADGTEYIFCNGFGSSNTRESRNGLKGAFDAANNALKMAKKRALVDAALAVSGLSSMFSQDIENEDFMNSAKDIYESTDGSRPITAKQVTRIYAIAAGAGYNAKQAKEMIIAMGFSSTKEIKQADYDRVCEAFKKADEET